MAHGMHYTQRHQTEYNIVSISQRLKR